MAAAAGEVFWVRILEASGIPAAGGMFGGRSGVYVALRWDEAKIDKSSVVDPVDGVVRWNWEVKVVVPPGAQQLVLEVKRPAMMGVKHLGGSALATASLDAISQGAPEQRVPLWDSSGTEFGAVLFSVRREEAEAPGGLRNRAGSAMLPHEAPIPCGAGHRGSGGAGGLVNYAGAAVGGSEFHRGSTASLQNHAGGHAGLLNHTAAAASANPRFEASGSPTGSSSMHRGRTMSLENKAAAGSDGKRPLAVQRAKALLMELEDNGGSSSTEAVLQMLGQALEELRHAPEDELHSSAGREVLSLCDERLRERFESAAVAQNESEASKIIWLAGKLAAIDDDDVREPLQNELRRRLDEMNMSQALEKAASLVARASKSSTVLEDLMGELDLAEFHAQHAHGDAQAGVQEVLAQLQAPLRRHLQQSLQTGHRDEVDTVLALLGAARVQSMGLEDMQEQLQQMRGSELLRGALMPVASQIGFPVLKQRQLRHAKLTARGALAVDKSGAMRRVLRKLFLDELFPSCVGHSAATTLAALDTAFDLGIFSADEVWAAIKQPYERLAAEEKQQLASDLPACCKQWRSDPPEWLLRPEQAACLLRLRAALVGQDLAEVQAACQQVLETDGCQAVCGEELRYAVERLRKEYRLPSSWDVGKMLASTETRMLAKTEITDRRVLSLFDKLLKDTAHPVWTRDRRGAVPQNFSAVRAVQVMNADVWAGYDRRRDEIANECRRSAAGHGERFWTQNLNGPIEGQDISTAIAELTAAPPLRLEANEAWLLHGTSHAAAEGITSEDFDMTRASPSGLFGAGVYFAESISKSDEYVEGRVMQGREEFPFLLCRVCLGHVYYCDLRRPDRSQLEAKCLRQDYHSVLGDRKKTSGTFREFIVYDNLQAFAAYIVYYVRQF